MKRSIEKSTECENELNCIHQNLQWGLKLIDHVIIADLSDELTETGIKPKLFS